MEKKNFVRMRHLAEEFFHVKNDPAQISVTEDVMTKLRQIHPKTLNEHTDGNGPIAWVLVIPTTREIMERFLANKISEQELLDKTPPGIFYDAIYLCSALVLPEYRGRGFAKRMMVKAVESIMEEHPVQSLFCWAFSAEGEKLAAGVARACALPLLRKVDYIDWS